MQPIRVAEICRVGSVATLSVQTLLAKCPLLSRHKSIARADCDAIFQPESAGLIRIGARVHANREFQTMACRPRAEVSEVHVAQFAPQCQLPFLRHAADARAQALQFVDSDCELVQIQLSTSVRVAESEENQLRGELGASVLVLREDVASVVRVRGGARRVLQRTCKNDCLLPSGRRTLAHTFEADLRGAAMVLAEKARFMRRHFLDASGAQSTVVHQRSEGCTLLQMTLASFALQ
mmetsp:Transcript_33437/g.89465  ORF Transcript_33437/g.89465 Transcript_33437/m.89465 type:complete len:236 (+) Transcript_33437:988-1695(+)